MTSKIFFSYLTSIRCAVIEGSHHVEAACQILQGYMLVTPSLLKNNKLFIPSTSTLFKAIPTMVYHCINDNPSDITRTVLKYLKSQSERIANDKEKIIHVTWHTFLLVFWKIFNVMEKYKRFSIHFRKMSTKMKLVHTIRLWIFLFNQTRLRNDYIKY